MITPHIPFIARIEIARGVRGTLRLTLTQSAIMGGGAMGLSLHAMGDDQSENLDMLDMLENACRALRERDALAARPAPPIAAE